MVALRIWRFVAILRVALIISLTFAHALELPAELTYDGPLYVQLQDSLYNSWGSVGAVTELGEILASVVVAVLVRRRRPAFLLTVAAVACLILALAVFFVSNNPANHAFAQASPSAIPADWQELRVRWETGHACSFGLHLVAFCVLLFSLLRDTAPV